MLVIRMQRTGRKGHAMFRVVVQDSRRTPTSGKIVAQLGSYDPHSKTVILDKESAQKFLSNGAQPSDRAAKLLKAEGIKLPDWVKLSADGERATRNPDKRRSTRPAEEAPEAPEAPEAADEPVEAETETAEPAQAETTEATVTTESAEAEAPAAETSEEPAADTAESAEKTAEADTADEAEAKDEKSKA